jgi:hypothetical protein
MRKVFALGVLAFVAFPTLALADGNGAVTGAAGGAIAGAVVGGPVGAAVGGVAGAVVGGATTGPGQPVVVEPEPGPAVVAPCNTRTTQTTDNTGYSKTTQTTNCSD